MQYNQETEKVAMMNSSYMTVPKPLSLTEDREVQRTRKILIIILGVCLALSVVVLVAAVFGSELTTEMKAIQQYTQVDEALMKATHRYAQVGEALIGILFYGFGIFVAHRYSATGLRVFAWLNIIQLVMVGIGIVLLLFALIIGISVANNADHGDHHIQGLTTGMAASIIFIIIIIIIIIGIAVFVLSVIIVKLTFKLARAIDANQRLIIQQA